MATVLEIIQGAALELGARPLNDTLSSEEGERGLIRVQSMYREAVEKGVFGRVTEVVASANYEASEQERVYSAGFTITLPTSVEDADTGENRRPRDLAMIQVVNDGDEPEINIYDAHLGDWVRIDGLALTDEAPFSGRNRTGLECVAARALASTFRKPVPDTTAAYAAGLSSVFSNRYSSPRTPADVEYF